VWDLNTTTAIPVICIAIAAFAFYVWSSIVASMVEDFPYTTIVSAVLRSKAVCRAFSALMKYLFEALKLLAMVVIRSIGPISFFLLVAAFFPICIIWTLVRCLCLKDPSYPCFIMTSAYDGLAYRSYVARLELYHDAVQELSWTLIVEIWKPIIATLLNPQTDEQTVSYSLSWLIQYCENPSSVSVALQAIAGATRKIQQAPLKKCKSSEEILKRLVSTPSGPKAAQEASLYARALGFLGSSSSSDSQQVKTRNNKKEDVAVMIWNLKSRSER
jgi:hypothetical protein